MKTIQNIAFSLAVFVIIAGLVGCNEKAMRQDSSSMEPTIKRGEVISVDLAAYSGTGPLRWDVVVFDSPVSGGEHWASRVVGLPGEMIDIRLGKVLIDGKEVAVPPRLPIGAYELPKDGSASGALGPITFPFKIPPGEYFVLGDNVSNALDSRYWGGLAGKKILGKIPGK